MHNKDNFFNQLKKDSTKYVFLDSRITRNLQDERNVSGEFHRMMRRRKVADENFETAFFKRITKNKRISFDDEKDDSLSMVVDVDSSECFSDSVSGLHTFDTSDGNCTSVINLSFDDCSDTMTSKTDVKEYVISDTYSTKYYYLSQSYDDLLFEFGRSSNSDETCLKKNKRGFSQEDLKSFLDRKKYDSTEETFKYTGNFDVLFSKYNFNRKNNKKRKKSLDDVYQPKRTNVILVDNVDGLKMISNADDKPRKPPVFRRIFKYFKRLVGLKKSDDRKENKSIKTDIDFTRTIESSYLDTDLVTTVYQASISKNYTSIEDCSTPSVSNILNNNRYIFDDKRIVVPSRQYYAASLSYPFRKWFRLKPRVAHSTGELLKQPYGNRNTKIDPLYIDLPDKKKLIDISRAYYPLTKWTLINRLFRHKNSSEKPPNQKRFGKGDTPSTKSVDGSVREGTDGGGRKAEVIPVSLSDVIIEDAVKTNGEKRSQDDDEDDCGSGWGYWLEYLMVLFVSVILLLGCVFLVLFWCFYYKKGYNSWKVERDQQFNLHPTLMVGAVVFTGFSVLMYRIGRCSRRLYVKLLHATFHLLAILCFVGGFLSIFEWHNMTNLTHFYSLHSWIGFITMGLFGIQFFVGFISFLVLLCCESATAGFRACLLPLHTTFGLTIFLISIATCLTGLVQRTNSTIGEENYPSLPEEAIVVNALGVALVAVGVVVTYALGRTSLRVKSDCYVSERL